MKPGQILRSLQWMHRVLLLGIVLFAGVAFYLKYNAKIPSTLAQSDHIFQLVAIAVSAAGVFFGATLFKKRVIQLRNSQQSVPEKAAAFRAVSIFQWALLEGPAIFCIACFLITGNLAFLGLAAVVMTWFLLTYPSKLKVMVMLRLGEEEMESF